MDDTSTNTTTLEQADEEILTYKVSDEALEAAAGTGERVTMNWWKWTDGLPCC